MFMLPEDSVQEFGYLKTKVPTLIEETLVCKMYPWAVSILPIARAPMSNADAELSFDTCEFL